MLIYGQWSSLNRGVSLVEVVLAGSGSWGGWLGAFWPAHPPSGGFLFNSFLPAVEKFLPLLGQVHLPHPERQMKWNITAVSKIPCHLTLSINSDAEEMWLEWLRSSSSLSLMRMYWPAWELQPERTANLKSIMESSHRLELKLQALTERA